MSGKIGLLIASLALGTVPSAVHADGSYLFVWAGDADEKESDFLAVIDTDASSATYGEVVATAPVGIKGTMPHHIEYELSETGTLFANGWKAGHTFVLNIADPRKPRLVADFKKAGDYSYPHSFARLPNGNVLATFQSIGEKYAPPGGLVELDSTGRMVRSTPSATRDIPTEINWPYSLAVHPTLDRIVTTSTDMGMGPGWKSPMTKHVQIWSMSNLKLLSSVALPESGQGDHHGWPAYVNTFTCGLYRLDGLDTPKPTAVFVHAFPGGTSEHDMCAVPIIYGKYWVQTVGATNGLIVLDISDANKPVEVSRLNLPASFHMPHWAAADRKSGRIAVTGANDSWVLMLKFDDRTGKLSIDETFGTAGRADFDGQLWPHGESGKAIVHGTVFSD
jgi:hypothetical protein